MAEVYQRLNNIYPPVQSFLNFKNPFELLVAVVLSAQCTDDRINRVTPALFERFPTPQVMALGTVEEIKFFIKSVTYFNAKALNLSRLSQQLVTHFSGKVPKTMAELLTLSGVGRKTANVVLAQAFDVPGIAVDTHVKRVSKRLGFTKYLDPEKIEQDLQEIWPKNIWNNFSTILIRHGRAICKAKTPACHSCTVVDLCPSGRHIQKPS